MTCFARASAYAAIHLVVAMAIAVAEAEAEESTLMEGVADDAGETAAGILSRRMDLSDPAMRAEVVAQLRGIEATRRQNAMAKVQRLGVPGTGRRRRGGEFVLRGFEGTNPIYEQTENADAAISSGAHLVRGTPPYAVDGTGVMIGLWETSMPRATHVEFGSPSRLVFGEGSSGTSDHATHVAGTMIAAGSDPSVMGMAPGASIIAYDSVGDVSEMTAMGASIAGEPGKIQISNHAYGIRRGWEDHVWTGGFSDDGDPANDVEKQFGRYSGDTSVLMDGVAYNLPYYLPFFSAGNHRGDGAPASGETWFEGVGGTERSYNPAAHPASDGDYKNGYDTCEGKKVAKNVMTVGAVSDAVSGGGRDFGAASLSALSSTGPTDDGRIKPDIVANGSSVWSLGGASDTEMTGRSGTSMASASAAGSAALLVNYYGSSFSGAAMRAATLKGLIIHTADDLGNAGPDYRHGWGLMNTEAAAALIKDHAESGGGRLMERKLTGSQASRSWTFSSDGSGPVRVTLCWTDPPGTNKVGHDNRERALVNDLNLKIIGPGGTHLPWVMPHVGDWSLATLDDSAGTGVNTVDNVEQVHVASPAAGAYTITVDHAGVLMHGEQEFSLIIGGLQADALVVAPDDDFTTVGLVGGAFAPATRNYTLTNNGEVSLDWSVSDDSSWLDVLPAFGSLAPGASILVTASVNAAAGDLSAGFHAASVSFSNTGAGVTTQTAAQLQVMEAATLPVTEDFEEALGNHWQVSGSGTYRMEPSTENDPHEGTRHLQMDSAVSGVNGRNELTLLVDLAGTQDVVLSFWAKEFADELNPPSASSFAGGDDFDGVAVSPDGITWYPVFSFPFSFPDYARYTIKLDEEVAAHGISYTDQFRIRFNQFDNFGIATDGGNSDGIAIDAIRIASIPAPDFAALPVAEGFESPLGSHWRVTGTGSCRAELRGTHAPHGGVQHLEMDSSVPASPARNELTLGVDLAGAEGVMLAFWAREFSEETHLPPAGPFFSGADFDGVAVSPDGLTWYPVFAFPEEFIDDTLFTIDLDAAVAAHGLAYNEHFRIRFNQYDNFSLTADGIVLDDVLVTEVRGPLERWRMTHFGTTDNSGHAANEADPNRDGIINQMAFAGGLDPLAPEVFPMVLRVVGEDLVVSYQRSHAALTEGWTFTIEWSDTLDGGWMPAGVVESVTNDDATLQLVDATLSNGSAGKRFVRLRVSE